MSKINTKNILKKIFRNKPEKKVKKKSTDKRAIKTKKLSKENLCSYGAYEIFRSNNNIQLTIIASGSEVSLALDISHKLATENIYSKVISVPCQELFEQQSSNYKNKILKETDLNITIEAGSTDGWKKYIMNKGLNFGIEDFGKSAPYKDIYKHFGLTATNIANKSKKLMRN